MKIGEWLKEYRKKMGISQRELARRCDISNSYLSMLEKDMNPATQKPIEVSIETYKSIADGARMTIDQLFAELGDDSPVVINLNEGMEAVKKGMRLPDLTRPFHQDVIAMLEADIQESKTKQQIRDQQHQDVLELGKIYESLTQEGQAYLMQQARIAKNMFPK